MLRIVLSAIVGFKIIVSTCHVGAQTGHERFEKVYSEIVNAEFDQLEQFDDNWIIWNKRRT